MGRKKSQNTFCSQQNICLAACFFSQLRCLWLKEYVMVHSFCLFFIVGGGGGWGCGRGRTGGRVGFCECVRARVYICVCLYTIHAKIPQPDESYPGTCNARLRRKFHILCYHRTSISFLVLDWFQSLIITTVTSEWRLCESGDQVVYFSPTSLHMPDTMEPSCFSFTHPQTMPPCTPGFGMGDLAVTDWQTSLYRQCVWASG